MPTKTIHAHFDRGMRFVARTGSGHDLVMDDRSGNSGPRPTEAVLAGLAACTAMDIVSILGKKRHKIANYEVQLTAEQRDEYAQIFTRIDLIHVVEGPRLTQDAVSRCIVLSAEKYCPVSAMLSAGATEIHHRYRMRDTALDGPWLEGEVVVTGPYRSTEPLPPG